MTLPRIAASAAVLAALAAVAVVLFGGGRGTEYHLHFTHAGLLVKGADVIIGGHKAGSVSELSLTGSGEADVTVRLTGGTRLHAGATATLEEPSLSGQANRYVQIDPGDPSARALAAGAVIDSGSTESVVEIDELYNLLDAKTRASLGNVIRGQRDAFAGRAADADRFYATFAPAVQASDRLFRELNGDGESLRRFVRSTGSLAGTLRASSADLYGTVEQSAAAVDAFASESDSLERAIAAMPATLREGRATFAALRAALPDFSALVEGSRPAFARFPAFAAELTAALSKTGTIGDLAAVLRSPGPGDDLVELADGLPALSNAALPAFRDGRAALTAGQPLIDELRPYTPDLVGMWGNTGRALGPYDANGHYARILPQFGAFRERTDGDGVVRMEPIGPAERTLGLRDGVLNRPAGSLAPIASLER